MKTGSHIISINAAKFISGIFLCFFITASFWSPAFAAPAADPQASSKTQSVLNYLTDLSSRSDNKIVSGQFTQDMTDINNVYKTTGKYVGMIGIDYKWDPISTLNDYAIAYSNNGGLVTVDYHFDNVVTGGNSWDTTYVDFVKLIQSGTSENTKFKAALDTVAAGLATLQNNNVVVLFRPFHEMNGGWFWWGAKNSTQYKNAWIYMFNYLTNTKGLHNLLWVYSSNKTLDTTYYPGSGYVDIVGSDYYGSVTLGTIAGYSSIPDNKPFAITEWGGRTGGTWDGQTNTVNIAPLISDLKAHMPKTAYWMAWNGQFSMSYQYNTNVTSLIADPWVVTRDEIVLSTSQEPLVAPSGLRVVSIK